MSLSTVTPATRSDTVEIELNGVVGLAASDALNRTLKQALHQGCKSVVVDLRQVLDVDSACWGRLVSAARRLRRQGGEMILRHCSPSLLAQLQAHQWDRCFLVPEHRSEDASAMPGPAQPRPKPGRPRKRLAGVTCI